MNPYPDLLDAIHQPARREELAATLTRWSEINSGSSHHAGLARMLDTLAEAFGRLPSVRVEAISLGAGHPRALRITARESAPLRVLLNGHMDTVFNADSPFQKCTRLDADTLRGPGVVDMKGGLLTLLTALQAFEKAPVAARLGWEVIIVPDEETGSETSAPLYTEVAKRHRLALVFEPCLANGDLVRTRMGTGMFTATVTGRAAHAGRARQEGRNAIVALAHLTAELDRLNEEMPDILLNVGRVEGGGVVNIVPDRAVAWLNVRTTKAGDDRAVLERMEALAASIGTREGYRAKIEGRFNRPPKEIRPGEPELFAALRGCAQELGFDCGWQHVGGGSDGNLLSAAGLACLDGLGPKGGQLHNDQEWVSLSSIQERARLAALFLLRLASGEIALP